ncbi:DUF4097 family beta strand repeat-containing protein [Oceanobacillus saliphilus]|uniref:DUF4097 family beta strand repeat-containing protein n=1 Tax=Oceanobacillus saliphilus TaxID=2925834 RepID=UPI00201E74BB|nr:DUF4097 family beta strand repeat-containing protein [Oceanobacillus saliphilus]
MSKVKKLSIVAILLLLVGVIGSIFTFNLTEATNVMEESKEFVDKDFTDIDVVADNAEIEILPSDNTITTVTFGGNDSSYHFSADVKDDILSIKVKEKRLTFINFSFSSPPKLKVYVPVKNYETLQIKGNNGKITVQGMQSEDIDVQTNNGRIELKDIQSTRLSTDTDNGAILLEHVEGEIIGRTNNGRVKVTVEHLDRPIDIQTDNGRIEIETKTEPTNAILDMKVDNGSVTVFGNSNWDTVIGEGENLIKLKTNNGKIELTKH